MDVGKIESSRFVGVRPHIIRPTQWTAERRGRVRAGKLESMFNYSSAGIACPLRKIALGLPSASVGKPDSRIRCALGKNRRFECRVNLFGAGYLVDDHRGRE